MEEKHTLLKFQAKYCPGDRKLEKPSACGSAGVLGQLDEQNMECFYCMCMYFMLKVRTCAIYN